MRAGSLLYDRLSHPGQAFLNLECIVVRYLFATETAKSCDTVGFCCLQPISLVGS